LATVEFFAEHFAAEQDATQACVDPRHHGDRTFGCVGDGSEAVDRRNLERQFGAANAGQFGCQDEQVGSGGKGRQSERNRHRDRDRLVRFAVFADPDDFVFEGDECAWIDLERHVHVEGSVAGTVRVEVDLPRLPVGVGLDEMPLIMDVEAVFGDMVLEVGDETLKVDHCHRPQPATILASCLPAASLMWSTAAVTDDDLLAVLHAAVDAVVDVFDDHDDWGLSGQRDGQYASDLAADAAALRVLRDAGIDVMSEESGGGGEGPVAVLDPLDGSTNASRPLPWFATSICVIDSGCARAAVVHDHASGVRWDASAGGGARIDGVVLPRREAVPLDLSVVAINGLPTANPGWAQFRCFGAAALDLCAVADGRFDAFVDFDTDALGPWDYLGGMLICQEVGVQVEDAFGRPLVVGDHAARRTPVAAVGSAFEELVASRRQQPSR